MKIPKEIDQYQKDYRDGAWAEYSDEEYRWWVHLLTQRATHRTNQGKKIKDLTDARNYLLMWITRAES